MEKRLKRLFDYQRFLGNDRLASLISDTESRYQEAPKELSEKDLDFINAAGETHSISKKSSVMEDDEK